MSAAARRIEHLRKGVSIAQHLACGRVHRCSRFRMLGVDAGIHLICFRRNEIVCAIRIAALQHVRPRDDSLRLQRAIRPRVRHLTRNDAEQIRLERQRIDDDVVFHDRKRSAVAPPVEQKRLAVDALRLTVPEQHAQRLCLRLRRRIRNVILSRILILRYPFDAAQDRLRTPSLSRDKRNTRYTAQKLQAVHYSSRSCAGSDEPFAPRCAYACAVAFRPLEVRTTKPHLSKYGSTTSSTVSASSVSVAAIAPIPTGPPLYCSIIVRRKARSSRSKPNSSTPSRRSASSATARVIRPSARTSA